MKRHLFLTGPAFSGKSSLIKHCLGSRLELAGGFCTELSADGTGALMGCTLFPTAAAGGAEGYEKALFLDLRQDPAAHDSEVFRGVGVRLLEEAAWYPFAVLDEIGGIDLIIPQFREALDTLLTSELPILGVIKPREEQEQMRHMLGLGDRIDGFGERLRRILLEDPHTEILDMEKGNGKAEEMIRSWTEEYTAVFGM